MGSHLNCMYYVISIVLLVAVELLYFEAARKWHIVDRPNNRSSHHRVALRGAGIVFYAALLLYCLTHHMEYAPMLMGATLLAAVCFADDLHPLPSWLRMVAQIAALVIAFYGQLYALHVWQLLLVVIVFVGVMNIYNFMDGINGMLAAYSLVVVGVFGYLNLFVVHFVSTEFLFTVIVSLLVFGFFNFRKNARCFAGDVGSVVMGFVVLFLLMRYDMAIVDNGENVSYLCFILVYLADGGLTVAKRFLNGDNILEAHRQHLYETLACDRKVPHLRVATYYALLQLVIDVGYLCVADKNLYTLLVAVGLVLAYGLFFFYCKRLSKPRN